MAKIAHYESGYMYISMTEEERQLLKADRVDVTVHPGSLTEFVRVIPNSTGGGIAVGKADGKALPYRIAVLCQKGVRRFGAETVKMQTAPNGVLIFSKPVHMNPPNPLKGQGRRKSSEAAKAAAANGNGHSNGLSTTLDNVFELQDRINSIKQTLGNNIVFSVREDGTLRITMDR